MKIDNDIKSFSVNQIKCSTKHLPMSNSVTIGVYLNVSLHTENKKQLGMSHFLEHMCFRGTTRRTSYQITHEVDALGGYINAFTSKEYTCYYITLLPECFDEGVDILFDVVFNSVLNEDAIKLEQSIINEEIKMYEDTPDEKIHDVFAQQMFKDSFLGAPILGTQDSISKFNALKLHKYYKKYFNTDNVNIIMAGKLPSKDRIKKLFSKHLSLFPFYSKAIPKAIVKHESLSGNYHEDKVIEQNHICIGYPGYHFKSDRRFALTLMATLLGGSMSSRLFQSIREKRGLAYSIYSSASFYRHSGIFLVYAGTSQEQFKEAHSGIEDELAFLLKQGISENELDRCKKQLKGNIIINLESSSSWMSWIGRQIIYESNFKSIEDVLLLLENVTVHDIQNVAADIINDDKKVVVSLGKKLVQ